MKNKLITAGIGGIFTLLLMPPLAYFETLWQYNRLGTFYGKFFFFGLLASPLVYILFLQGFILLAKKEKIPLLFWSGYLLIIFNLLYTAYLLWSRFFSFTDYKLVELGYIILSGLISIIFGLGLLKLGEILGPLAKWAGWLTIISGIGFITVIFIPAVFLLLITASVMEIIILFKVAKEEGDAKSAFSHQTG